jgi:hypothetical protein
MESMLEENARANPDARIHPLTHASDDQAHQAELVGRNSSFSILIAIRRSPNFISENKWGNCLFRDLKKDPLQLQGADF